MSVGMIGRLVFRIIFRTVVKDMENIHSGAISLTLRELYYSVSLIATDEFSVKN